MPATPPYTSLKAGTVLWHVHGDAFSSTSFNPHSTGRFSGRHFHPTPRAMYYAGDTPAAALWETVLSNCAPALDSNVVAVDPTTGRRLARMRLQQDVPVLELIAPQVKALAGGDAAFRHALQEATVWHEHAATHTVAERLLNRFSRAAGLRWHSRQSSKEIATLLYLPPAAEDWLVELDSVALDTPSGFAYIDEALAEFGWVRLDADALALETEVPDDADDEV